MKSLRKLKQKKPRNKFEQKIFDQLKVSSIKFSYESEKIPYVISGYYIPDFILSTPLGKIYLETKGYFRPEHKRKMLAVKKMHPELDIRIIFYASTKSNSRWAVKNGFKYSIGYIPEEWFKGY